MITIEPCVINGETSTDLLTIKLRRQTLHPGVFSSFIEEATPFQSYVRGAFFHVWVVPKAGGEAFVEHLKKFEPKALSAYFKELRKQFPATEAQVEKAADLMDEVQAKLNDNGVGFTIDLKNFAPQTEPPPPPSEGSEDSKKDEPPPTVF